MRQPTQAELNESAVRVQGASQFQQAKFTEFSAALMNGTKREVERARLAAVAAVEAYLDAVASQHRLQLLAIGIDPDTRP